MCRFIKYLVIYLYILYTVYMIYSIAEFRKCTREALNKVDDGEEVLIERYGIHYSIKAESKPVRIIESFSADTSHLGDIIEIPRIATLDARMQPKVCKNGHPIPYPKDRCLGKGCKYS